MQKLSDRQIRSIFVDRKRSVPALAELYGVSRGLISLIRHRKHRASATHELPDYNRINHVHLKSGNFALSPKAVKQIYESDLNDEKLAHDFNVSLRTIRRIRNGHTYNQWVIKR